jgi:hypothetical protein
MIIQMHETYLLVMLNESQKYVAEIESKWEQFKMEWYNFIQTAKSPTLSTRASVYIIGMEV